jgi:hypothetical protein
MNHLSNQRARQIGKRELRKVFTACKFRDALTLSEGDPTVPDDFIFYYNKARNGSVGNYIVYEVIGTDAASRADDAVMGRDFFASVEVFSVKSFESKFLTDTLAKLEEKLTAAGFEVDAQGEDYEPDTRLYRQTFYVSKIII